jgi:L-lactate dehydrogenase complex protein LldF
MASFSAVAKRPSIYRPLTSLATRSLAWAAGKKGKFTALPMAGAWTHHKDLPAPQGESFQTQWRARKAKQGGEQ